MLSRVPGKVNNLLMSLVVILAAILSPRPARTTENEGVINGVVKRATGEPAAGGFVKVRNPERKLTFLVISQDQGRFRVAKLPPGKYQVQGIGGGMQTEPPATVDLAAGQQITVNLTLNGPQPKPQADAFKEPLTARDYENLSVWSSNLPRNWVHGDAAKYTVVEFALSDDGADPHDVAVDSKGIAWVSERGTGFFGRFDPESLTYSRIPVPPGTSGKLFLSAIEVDGQDRVWASDGPNRRLVQYDPKTRQFHFFTVPEPTPATIHFNTIRFHPDGSVWGTNFDGNQLMRLELGSEKFTAFEIPSGVGAKDGTTKPYGMAVDGNRKIWFTEITLGKIGMLDPSSGHITEYNLPFPKANPRRMVADAEGNLWFCLGIGDWQQGGKLGKIDYRSSEITYYDPPTAMSGPSSPGVDQQHNLIWLSETPADQLARFDPRTKTFVEYALPTRHSEVRRIEMDRSHPNRVWFSGNYDSTNLGYNKIGYLEVLGGSD